MKKTSFAFLLAFGALLAAVSCTEDFESDTIPGKWQVDQFKYFMNPDNSKDDTIFAATDVLHDTILQALTPIDSLYDTILIRYGWDVLLINEDQSVYSDPMEADSAYGYWDKINDDFVRVWVNGKSLNLVKDDEDHYFSLEYINEEKYRKVFWSRRSL